MIPSSKEHKNAIAWVWDQKSQISRLHSCQLPTLLCWSIEDAEAASRRYDAPSRKIVHLEFRCGWRKVTTAGPLTLPRTPLVASDLAGRTRRRTALFEFTSGSLAEGDEDEQPYIDCRSTACGVPHGLCDCEARYGSPCRWSCQAECWRHAGTEGTSVAPP